MNAYVNNIYEYIDSPLREDFVTEDAEYRYAYAEDFSNTYIATQIKVLRDQRGMTQEGLAEAIGTKQSGISRLENVNYSSWKTETLRKTARALGVRLRISFETFGSLLGEDAEFSRESLKRPKFEDDLAFKSPAGSATATYTAETNLILTPGIGKTAMFLNMGRTNLATFELPERKPDILTPDPRARGTQYQIVMIRNAKSVMLRSVIEIHLHTVTPLPNRAFG